MNSYTNGPKPLFSIGKWRNRKFGICLPFLAMLFAFNANLMAQGVAINEDDTDANAKAALDVKSTTKGILLPNLSETQRNALPSPATGLIIFNRTVGYFNYYNGLKWCKISRVVALTPAINPAGTAAAAGVGVGIGIADPDDSAILQVNANNKGVLLPRLAADIAAPPEGLMYFNTAFNVIKVFDGTTWISIGRTVQVSPAAGAGTAEGVAIGATTVDASAKLDVVSASLGVLLPRMTTAERNAIPSPAEGLLLYNTTLHQLEYFVDNAWYKLTGEDNTYGKVVGNPGLSCLDIYQANSTTIGVDGVYYINPTGSATIQCNCDMTNDGGGWTLVVSFSGATNANGGTAMFRATTAGRDPAAGNVSTDISSSATASSWWTDLRWGPATSRTATWSTVPAANRVYNGNTTDLITWLSRLGLGGATVSLSPSTSYKCTYAAGYVTYTHPNPTNMYILNFPNNNWNIPAQTTTGSWAGYVPSVDFSGGSVLSFSKAVGGGGNCNAADARTTFMQAWVK